MRFKKCLAGTENLRVILAYLKERLEALISDERYEEAAEIAGKINGLEKRVYEEFLRDLR